MKLDKLNSWLTLTANLGVIASMVFIGLEIRQNTIQAQAAAYQAIGSSSSEWHLALDGRRNRLFTEANYPVALERWTLADWEAYSRAQLSALRSVETVMPQVELGLLDANAMERLGYALENHAALVTPGFECIWPDLKGEWALPSGSRLMRRARTWAISVRSTWRPCAIKRS